ncbi:MAG: ABC transporter ATP-binding protein [Oscillospiraceae bacterium]|nr:ABC transporter ATP-binding protein [Oscillospiraceae bacterium]
MTPALELRGIEKRYRGKTVLRGASMSAEAGSITGLLGSNGSGKSTLLNLLAGVTRPNGGGFFWRGEELFRSPRRRAAAVGYVPQGTPLMEELSALDNLRLWYAAPALAASLDHGALKALGVGEFLRVRASRLSGGMKKRLCIGCALAASPELLLLDEPSTALDLAGKAELLDQLRRLRDGGTTLLIATHDLQEIALCDALWLLRDGTLRPYAYDGDPAHLAAELG